MISRKRLTGGFAVPEFESTLKDGRRVLVRPVLPHDKQRLVDGFERLSERSVYLRFHAPLSRISDDHLAYLTELDHKDHVAWGARSMDEPGEPGAGLARYVRTPNNATEAEIAITVVDDWQGVGLGRLLLQTLMTSAAAQGVEWFLADVLPENHAAIFLLRGAGGTVARRDGELVRVIVPVVTAARALRSSRPLRLIDDRLAGD